MPKLVLFGALVLLLDVFPGNCGGCGASPTIAGPCQTSCDCDPNMAAPIRCPGEWACNADRRCEYSCGEVCADDGGCSTAERTCDGVICKAARTCQ